MVQIKIKKGQPYPLGATVKNSGINFSMVNSSDEECGLILYHKQSGDIQRLVFEKIAFATAKIKNCYLLFFCRRYLCR